MPFWATKCTNISDVFLKWTHYTRFLPSFRIFSQLHSVSNANSILSSSSTFFLSRVSFHNNYRQFLWP